MPIDQATTIKTPHPGIRADGKNMHRIMWRIDYPSDTTRPRLQDEGKSPHPYTTA
jgi:hypothetical protein